MTPGICLSRAEVQELTRTPMRKGQIKFLVRNGIRHYVDNHGWPVVLRSTIEGTPVDAKAAAVAAWKPNKA